jgi:hypothetical protein
LFVLASVTAAFRVLEQLAGGQARLRRSAAGPVAPMIRPARPKPRFAI